MAERPTTRGFQYGEDPVGSGAELAARFGGPVWLPVQWPAGHDAPEILVLVVPPGFESFDNQYLLRSVTKGVLLVVHGFRRRPGNLDGGLVSLGGERFETWTRPADQDLHIVVRAPNWDVHVLGSVTFDTALTVGRSLVQVAS